MSEARSHSLAELVAATGFDRRTIVYYIQSGLLPKVGRRGPHTRYPADCMQRLLFIQGVKTLQAEGKLLTATLAEIRRALGALDSAGIGDLLSRGLPVDALTVLFAELPEPVQAAPVAPSTPEFPAAAAPSTTVEPSRAPAGERRSYGLADAGIRKRFSGERPPAPAPTPPEAHHDETHPGLPVLAAPPIMATMTPAALGTGVEAAAADPELGELLRELEVRPTLNARRSPPGAPEQWTEIPITSRVYLSVRGLAEDDVPLAEAVARLLKRALRARSTSP